MDLLRDLPSRNSVHFSQYSQDSYKHVDAKRSISLKDQNTDDSAQVIVMDKQSVLRCELEKSQRKKSTKRINSDDSSCARHTKLRKTNSSEESTNDERESDLEYI